VNKKSQISAEEYTANKDLIKRIIARPSGSPAASINLLDVGALETLRAQGRGIAAIRIDFEGLKKRSTTSPDDFDALRFGAANFLALGVDLSPSLREWIADYLMGHVQCPARKKGTKSKTGIKILIPHLVEFLVKKGMTPTRSISSPACSACDVVADAFKESRVSPSSYRYIEGIWGKRSRSNEELPHAVFRYTP
jgi:hypothetical protein